MIEPKNTLKTLFQTGDKTISTPIETDHNGGFLLKQKTTINGRLDFPYSSTNDIFIMQDNGAIGYGKMIPFSNTGKFEFDNSYIGNSGYEWKNNGSAMMSLNSNGNMSIGRATRNSTGIWRNFNFYELSMSARQTTSIADAMIGTNYYFDTSNQELYSSSNAASRIFFNNSTIKLQTAYAGTSGNPISWNDSLTVDVDGNLQPSGTYKSSDGTLGYNGILTIGTYTITVKDGIITDVT